MKKLRIGDRVIEVDESEIRQLSDDELDEAVGGTGSGSKQYCRLVCSTCHFASWWGMTRDEADWVRWFHERQNCKSQLTRDCAYFDSDPNL
jgi:hypothetical protein